jgi:glycosyltransferase involved in cell wall biosynthesis
VSQLLKNDHFDIVQYPNLAALALFHRGEVPAVIRCSSDTRLRRANGGYDLENGWAIKQRHLLEVRAARRCNAVYAPSELVANVVSNRIKQSVKVIRPPVFTPSVQADNTILKRTVGKAPFLLFVGTLNRLKGLPILTKIIAPILNQHPNIHWVLAGQEGTPGNPNPLKNDFLKAAGKNHHRIHFTGALSHTFLIPFYQEALAIVLPSLGDNLPNTMLEGMLHGGIVIGTKGASFDEIITDGVNGLLCEKANPESLLQAIDEALSLDDPRRALMVRAAKKRIDMFRPETVIPQTVTYFEDVIQNHGCAFIQDRS